MEEMKPSEPVEFLLNCSRQHKLGQEEARNLVQKLK